MSYPIVIPWLPATTNLATIAAAQTLAAAGPLVLNSSLPSFPFAPYVFDRVVRAVSLTSAGDDSGVTFTIKGIGSPVDALGNPTQVYGPITENVVGPNANTVQSVNIYSQVISITADAPVPVAVSAGFGTFGVTDYVFLDYNRTIGQTSVSLQFVNQTALSAAVYKSLNKPETINIDEGNLIPFAIPAFEVIAPSTDNQFNASTETLAVVWATMTLTAADSLYFTVLQQGIR